MYSCRAVLVASPAAPGRGRERLGVTPHRRPQLDNWCVGAVPPLTAGPWANDPVRSERHHQYGALCSPQHETCRTAERKRSCWRTRVRRVAAAADDDQIGIALPRMTDDFLPCVTGPDHRADAARADGDVV